MTKSSLTICFLILYSHLPLYSQKQERFSDAIAYLEKHHGHALLIYHQQELVSETYLNGWKQEKPHRLASGTKSFSGALALIAESDNLIQLDEKVSQTITEWKSDAHKKDINIRELLSLRSGIDGGKIGRVPSYKESIHLAEVTHSKGKFDYGPIPFQIFGELMTRKLQARNETLETYLKEKLFDPIDLKPSFWKKNSDNPQLPSGAFLTARQWAKFGLLLINHGKSSAGTVIEESQLKKLSEGSQQTPHYGLCFWYSPSFQTAPDCFVAAGAGKQMLAMIPSKNLVVVQFAEAKRGYQKEKLMELILKDL